MDQMITLLTIHTNCVHLIHRPAAPAVVANLHDIVQQPDEPVSVHSESNNVGSNSRQLFEIETDPNNEGSMCSITAASLHCSDGPLPTSAADLAPIVADMRTEGPVTFSPLPHHFHDKACHNSGVLTSPTESSGLPRREIPPQSPPILPCWGQATDARVETYSQEVRPYYSYLISIDSSRQSSEAYQDPPRLLPRQSSSSPYASSTPPPAEIIPPPRPPEPDMPAEVQPASPLPSQQPTQPPLPRILLQRSGDAS